MPRIKRGKPKHPNKPVRIIKDRRNEVTARVILIISEREVRDGNTTNHIRLQVVQWSSNQTAGGQIIPSPVTLEKRRLHIRRDGVIRWGKAMGFTLDDLRIIADPANQQRIIQALQS